MVPATNTRFREPAHVNVVVVVVVIADAGAFLVSGLSHEKLLI